MFSLRSFLSSFFLFLFMTISVYGDSDHVPRSETGRIDEFTNDDYAEEINLEKYFLYSTLNELDASTLDERARIKKFMADADAEDEKLVAVRLCSLRDSISNEFDKKFFSEINNMYNCCEGDGYGVDYIGYLGHDFVPICDEFHKNRDNYSIQFLAEVDKLLISAFPEIFGFAIGACIPFDGIKIIIDSLQTVDPTIAELLYWKWESQLVFEMRLFAYFVSRVAKLTLNYWWEDNIMELWKENKSYLIKVFNYIDSTYLYRNENLAKYV